MFVSKFLFSSPVFAFHPFFDADNGGGGGGGDDDDNVDFGKLEWTKEQQDEINRIAAGVRQTARNKAKKDFEAELSASEQEAERKRQQEEDERKGNFEKVKTELETQLAEVTVKADQKENEVTVLRTFVDTTLEREIEGLPEVIKAFDPGPDTDIQTRIEWLDKAREQADKLGGEEKPTGRLAGNRPPRKPSNPDEKSGQEDTKKVGAALRRSF